MHIFGKGEVECSIHSVGTTNPLENKDFSVSPRFQRMPKHAERRGNKRLFARICGAKSVQFVHRAFTPGDTQ